MNNFFSEKKVDGHETWLNTIRGARTKWAHLCSLFVVALLVNFSNPVAAQITIDGNPVEWGTGAVTSLPSFTYIADPFGSGVVDNQFAQGKDIYLASDLIWSIGQTKAKNDLANGAAVILNGNLYFAGDRTSNNGDAQIGFWFYLNGTGPVIQPDGTHNFAPPHTVGDLLILADFTGGGRNALVTVYKWVDSGGDVANSNGHLMSTNIAGTVAENNANVYPIPSGWSFTNTTYDTNEFYEGVINLSAAGVTNFCFSSFLLEARSSQQVTASLDDFIGGPFNGAPTLVITNPAAVCAPSTVDLTAAAITAGSNLAGGSLTYWLDAAGTQPLANPSAVAASGTYYIKVTTVNSCTDIKPVVVTINPLPNANAGADKVLTCTVTSIALSGSSSTAGATFAWVASNGGHIVSGANTATPTVDAAGTYTLTVSANGCSASDVALVTLNNTPPNVNAGADKVLTCTVTSIALSGSSSTAGATFAWVASNGGHIVSGANTATPTVDAAGTYTLTVTDPVNGCTASDVALVTLNNTPPNANAGADKVLTCVVTSIALSGSSSTAGATFAWVASNGGHIVSGANTATPTVDAAGTYTLTVTNPANGCTASDVALVTLNNTPPNVNAGADKVLTCTITSIALSGSSSTAGATFAWVASNGGHIVSGANTATPTVDAAGTYTLTVTDPVNGCTASDVALVTVNGNLPNVNAGADKVLTCTVTSIALSGSSSTAGATFAWVASNGGHIVSGANTATPTVDAAGTYTLTVTDPANGCTASDVALVTLNNTPPNVNAGADKVLTCTVTSIALSGSSSTAGATFAWVASNGGHIVSGANTATPTVDAAGTYTLTVTDPVNGCTASDVALVTLNNTPPNVNAGADKVLTCTVTSIALSGSSATAGATFAWVASNGGHIVSGGTTATPTVDAAGTYTLTVTDPVNGCTASDVALVTLNNTPPDVNAGADKVLTCVVTSIALSGSSSTAGAMFAWVASNGGHIVSGANSATPTVDAAGTYTLTVTDPINGCTASDVALVTLNNTPPNVSAGDDLLMDCGQTSGQLSGSSTTPNAIFAWSTIDGHIVSGANSATVIVDLKGTYTLTVTDPVNGCTASDDAFADFKACQTIVELCTYTQGFYGSQKGNACDLTGLVRGNIFVTALLSQGNLVLGSLITGNNVIFLPGDAAKIDQYLPGGGSSYALTGSYTSTLPSSYLKNGNINNTLLAQTITLGLNLRIGADLAAMPLQSGMFASQAKLDCPKGSGLVEPVCVDGVMTVNPYKYYTLSAGVLCYMSLNGYDMTVQGLYNLANDALGKVKLFPASVVCGSSYNVTLSDIAGAVDMINNAFDGCRAFVGYVQAPFTCPKSGQVNPFDQIASASMKVYPNPFVNTVTFQFTAAQNTHAILEIHNVVGQLVKTVFDANVAKGELNTIEFEPVNLTPGVLFYRLILGDQVQTGQVIYQGYR